MILTHVISFKVDSNTQELKSEYTGEHTLRLSDDTNGCMIHRASMTTVCTQLQYSTSLRAVAKLSGIVNPFQRIKKALLPDHGFLLTHVAQLLSSFSSAKGDSHRIVISVWHWDGKLTHTRSESEKHRLTMV